MRIRIISLLILFPLAASSTPAAVRRVGAEFQVNTYTTYAQARPAAAMASSGEFVVLWSSEGEDGDYEGIFGRRYNSLGQSSGGAFQVNSYTTYAQTRPSAAMGPGGGFVVVWTSDYQDGDSFGVFGRLLDGDGDPLGGEFQVNTYTTSYQYQPVVAADAFGGFVVAWTGGEQDGSSRGIFAQRFDSGGAKAGAEFRVNTYTTGVQRFPAVAMDGTGAFVVVWESHDQDGQNGGIFGKRYDSGGQPLGAEFQVNTYTTGTQLYPAVAVDPGGGFLVVWQSPKPAIFEASGRRYDSAGQPVGGEFQVSESVEYDQFYPAVGSEGTGGFVVVWEESFADGSAAAIVGRRIDAAGTPTGEDFQVNTFTTDNQRHAAIAMDPVSDLVVAWQSEHQDGYGYGVFAQRHLGRVPGLTSHAIGDPLDCSDPAVTRPTFTWDPDGYDKFRVSVSSTSGFLKGSVVTSGDTLLSGTSWSPSKKKWRRACAKAVAANPVSPVLFIKILGKDTDLSKRDRDRLRESAVVMGAVQP